MKKISISNINLIAIKNLIKGILIILAFNGTLACSKPNSTGSANPISGPNGGKPNIKLRGDVSCINTAQNTCYDFDEAIYENVLKVETACANANFTPIVNQACETNYIMSCYVEASGFIARSYNPVDDHSKKVFIDSCEQEKGKYFDN